MRLGAITGVLAGLTALGVAAPSMAQVPLVMEEAMVDSPQPGQKIYVRNKHAEGMTAFTPERTVLFVHGATYPASTAFDLELGGLSWMDYIAQRGFDVYLLDLPGWLLSTAGERRNDQGYQQESAAPKRTVSVSHVVD